MMLLKRLRLSVTPVTKAEWKKIHEMAGADPKL
jgi:predicted RNA-binding protein with PUA-like domain